MQFSFNIYRLVRETVNCNISFNFAALVFPPFRFAPPPRSARVAAGVNFVPPPQPPPAK